MCISEALSLPGPTLSPHERRAWGPGSKPVNTISSPPQPPPPPLNSGKNCICGNPRQDSHETSPPGYMIRHKGWIYGRRGLEIICKDCDPGRGSSTFCPFSSRWWSGWVLLAGWNWTKVLISSYHCLFWICQGQQYFPPKYLSTYFKSDGGRFRFSRLASPGLPSAHSNVWLHLRNLDGAIGHATLNPQGDHSCTQLVLTKQSFNFTDIIPSSSLYLDTAKVLYSTFWY